MFILCSAYLTAGRTFRRTAYCICTFDSCLRNCITFTSDDKEEVVLSGVSEELSFFLLVLQPLKNTVVASTATIDTATIFFIDVLSLNF